MIRKYNLVSDNYNSFLVDTITDLDFNIDLSLVMPRELYFKIFYSFFMALERLDSTITINDLLVTPFVIYADFSKNSARVNLLLNDISKKDNFDYATTFYVKKFEKNFLEHYCKTISEFTWRKI